MKSPILIAIAIIAAVFIPALLAVAVRLRRRARVDNPDAGFGDVGAEGPGSIDDPLARVISKHGLRIMAVFSVILVVASAIACGMLALSPTTN